MKAMQCKHIPDAPVLLFLKSLNGAWGNWCYGDERDVSQTMPGGTPQKLVLAKMRMLMKRGLVDGCGCGCRGDFVLTDKGRAFLGDLNPSYQVRTIRSVPTVDTALQPR